MEKENNPPPVSTALTSPFLSATSPTRTERNWAIFAHLASVVGWVGVPFGHVLAPLVVWLVKRDDSKFVRSQAIESLNFQISMTLYAFLAGLLAITIVGLVIAIPLLIVLVFGDIIFTILGAIRVNDGEAYRYPATIRIL